MANVELTITIADLEPVRAAISAAVDRAVTAETAAARAVADRDEARLQVTGLAGQIVGLRADVATLSADRDRLATQNTELARLYEQALERIRILEEGDPDVPPDPPTSRTMTVGAIIGSGCHTVASFITAIGTPGVRRYFASGDFDAITNNPSVRADIVNGVARWDQIISYKPPKLTLSLARLHGCLASCPDDGRTRVIMGENEPERADKGNDAATWVRYIDAFIEAVVAWADANGRGPGSRSPILPGWSFSYWRPLTDPTISAWWPTCPNRARAVFGCQSYDPNSRKTLAEQTKIPVDRWRTAAGDPDAPWMLSEVNTHRTGDDGATWWAGLEWAARYGSIAACPYDDTYGKDGPWCIVDRTVQRALGEMMPKITVTI